MHRLIEWIFWKRVHLCLMVFFGLFNTYTLRNSINVAIVKMKADHVVPETVWGFPSESVILMSFFPLYCVANLFGGSIAERFGSKLTFGWGILLTSLVTLFIPLAARHHYISLMAVRVIQGILEGLSIPVAYTIYGKWFPRSERTLLRSICESGFDAGFLIGNTITGFLCDSPTLGGWPSVFYIFAGFSVLWSFVWWLCAYETPAEHPTMSEKERTFILFDQGDEFARNGMKTPWSSILKDRVIWSLLFPQLIGGLFIQFIRLEYPTYLKEVFNFQVSQIGWMSMLPQVMSIIAGILSSILGDFVINHSTISQRTLIRKAFNVASTIPTAAAQVGMILIENNPAAITWMMTLAYGLASIDNAGGAAIPIDMSPVFAGSIFGLLNAVGNASAVFSPLLIGYITKADVKSRYRWNIVFYIALATNIFSTLVFVIFVKADLTPWGLGNKEEGPGTSSLEMKPVASAPIEATGKRASYDALGATSTSDIGGGSTSGVKKLREDLKVGHTTSERLSTPD